MVVLLLHPFDLVGNFSPVVLRASENCFDFAMTANRRINGVNTPIQTDFKATAPMVQSMNMSGK